MTTFTKKILLFTDGASKGNPGPGGWGAVVLQPDNSIFELGGADPNTTNNRMELQAVIEGLEALGETTGDLAIFTDSLYVLKGINFWISGWIRKGWITKSGGAVANRELWQKLHTLHADRKALGKVSWHHLPGHAGIAGNERADAIAEGMASSKRIELFQGNLDRYGYDLLSIPEGTDILENPDGIKSVKKSKSKSKPYAYLSLADGVACRHLTWSDCEARVKGRRGVKFKKVMSKVEEDELLQKWGDPPIQ